MHLDALSKLKAQQRKYSGSVLRLGHNANQLGSLYVFYTMLDRFTTNIFALISGHSPAFFLQEITGISERTWRDGGPKRPTTVTNKLERIKKTFVFQLQKEGWSQAEIDERFAFYQDAPPTGVFSLLTKMFSMPGDFSFPHTQELAKKFDDSLNRVNESLTRNDPLHLAKTIRDEGILDGLRAWSSTDPKFFDPANILLSDTETAPKDHIFAICFFYFAFHWLAMWDVETFQALLGNGPKGMTPQPMLEYLHPATTKDVGTNNPARALFVLPLSKLLNLTYCCTQYVREGRWPLQKEVTRAKVAMHGGDILMGQATEQPIAKIRRGTRGLTSREFNEIWRNMLGKEHQTLFPPPWCWYIGAQILGLMLVKKDKSKHPIQQMIVLSPEIYRYCWRKALEHMEQNGAQFGNTPWPRHLKTI